MSLPEKYRTAAAALLLLLASGAAAVLAQDGTVEPGTEASPAEAAEPPVEAPARNPTDVVARVGDEEITEQQITIAETEFANELAQVPEEERRSVLIDAVVNVKLLAQAARDEGLDQGEEFQQLLEFRTEQVLRNEYIEKIIQPSLTEEDLQQGYQELVVGQHEPQEEVHARHILVETEEEAQRIIDQLNEGASFAELATQSLDQTGQNGGDLGFFGRGQMVPPFEEAAFALEPGAFTQAPVQSEFGWHVILVEEKRMSEPPPFADLEQQLRDYLLRQKFDETLTALREEYGVEIVGEPADDADATEGEAPEPEDAATDATEAPAEEPAN
jgi:peptidyl-prolyl cis-trans isomerase C